MQSFDYTRMLRYSTNNGTAIGTDFAEAAIHAINERIERDAEGLFLIRTFLRDTPKPMRLVPVESLPSRLKTLAEDINRLTNERMFIIDITTDIGVPSF